MSNSNLSSFLFFLVTNVLFLTFFGIQKGCGHIHMLITFPGDTDSKYRWFVGLT